MKCRICGNEVDNRLHLVKEMMFKTGEEFEYVECAKCGCLQIKDVPNNMNRYYGANYYSINKKRRKRLKKASALSRYLRRKGSDNILGNTNFIGKFFAKPAKYFDILEKVSVNTSSRILDVGSGEGRYLSKLYGLGFMNLTGVDPFVDGDRHYGKGFDIIKGEIFDLEGRYDLILFSHSFEHMDDHIEVLRKAEELISQNGFIVIDIPVASGYAWKKYGTNWVQLDAPRHFYLHTEKSIEILVRETGLTVDRVEYNSSAFQFLGSEQYEKGIALMAENSYKINREASMFNADDFKKFEEMAEELNRQKKGDQAVFFLRKV